jgi:methyl-accepting chemotaxis protein
MKRAGSVDVLAESVDVLA